MAEIRKESFDALQQKLRWTEREKERLSTPDHETVLISREEAVRTAQEWRNRKAALTRLAKKKLSASGYEVYDLCIKQGLTKKAAAERLGIKPGTVRERFSQAIRKLQEAGVERLK